MKVNLSRTKVTLAAGAVVAAFSLSMMSMSHKATLTDEISTFQDDKQLIGAGSSFDYPLFTKMFSDYNTSTGVQVNYQSVGSGAGISQLTNKTVDFGATDAPMSGKQASALTGPA